MTKEEVKNEIEQCEKKLEELRKRMDEPENQCWRAKHGISYWYLNGLGHTRYDLEYGTQIDDMRYDCGNYFKTEDEAKEFAKRVAVYRGMMELSDGCGDWVIGYNHISVEPRMQLWTFNAVPFRFSSRERAWECIRSIGSENLKKYWFGVKECP